MVQQLYGIARKWKDQGRTGWNYLYKVNKLLANIGVPLTQYGNSSTGIDDTHEIIVSLTTFPERISTVWITIATMMNQTYKPKKIILWLAKDQFPDEKGIPHNLLRLKKRGLEICFCDDLKPHKKYYYTMQKYPHDYVVTVDDDVLYPENHLEQLWQTHLKYPKAVCCQYSHRITYTPQGNIEKYENWESCYGKADMPTLQILPVGCGGVLYPPNVLHQDLLKKDYIEQLCPMMDDLWLKGMAALQGTKAVLCSRGSLIYFDTLGTRKSGLQHSNAGEKKNDIAISNILKKYPQIETILYQDYLQWKKLEEK